MIYIKDYRSLNSLVGNHNEHLSSRNNIRESFMPLIGRAITVFVDGGSICGGSFNGILTDVLSDGIQLTAIPFGNFNRRGCNSGFRPNMSRKRKESCGVHRTKILILFSHITAFAYYSI